MTAHLDFEPLCAAIKSMREQASKMLYGRRVSMFLAYDHKRNGKEGIIVGVDLDNEAGIRVLVRFLKEGADPKLSLQQVWFRKEEDFVKDDPESFSLGCVFLRNDDRRIG